MEMRDGICPVCGHGIRLPREVEHAFCPECGSSIEANDAFFLAEHREYAPEVKDPRTIQNTRQQSAEQETGLTQVGQVPIEQLRRGSSSQQTPSQQQAPQTSLSPFGAASPWQQSAATPFLTQWKTDVPFTILGLMLRFMLAWTIVNVCGGQAMIDEALTTGVITPTSSYIIGGGCFDLACAIAAFVTIPKRFRKDFEGKNYLVSFANALIGGLVFGLYWNNRLTKRKLGVSHLIFFVLLATNGISSITMLMFTM